MAIVKDMYVKASKDTRQAARDYWLNTAFLSGNQWIYWDTYHDTPRERPEDDRVRMVVNRMATNHRTLISHLTQRELMFEVAPTGADDASVHASYIATEILYHLRDDHNWERTREEVVTSILKGGVGAIALDWDATREDSVETVLSVAEFVVEPGARDPERARWWIKAQVLSPEEVQAIYDMEETPDADATSGMNPLQEKLLASHLDVDSVNPLTLALTYYERPNPANPDGRVLVEVGDQILEEGVWPFPFDDRLNLVVGVETVIDNKWFGETIYSQARAPQVALNYAKSNLSEHLRDASQARMLVPHSAIRTMESLNDVPGNMYPYPDGLEKPSWLQPPQLPHWLQDQEGRYKADIDDLMGVHDVSRGIAPGRIESGTGVAILVEQDTSPVGRLIKETAGMFSRLSRMNLQLHQKMTKTERVAVIDVGAGPLSLSWRGGDIQDQFWATVPLDSIMPRSRAAQQQMAERMLEMGLITDVVDFARFAEHPNLRSIVQQMAPDAARAAREHSLMAQGEVLTPATYDDHAAHISEHNNFRKTVAYERLSPADREKADLHIQAHETLAAEEAAKMVTRAAADPALAGVPSADGSPVPEVAPPVPDAPLPAPAEVATVEPDPAQMLQELEAAFQ